MEYLLFHLLCQKWCCSQLAKEIVLLIKQGEIGVLIAGYRGALLLEWMWQVIRIQLHRIKFIYLYHRSKYFFKKISVGPNLSAFSLGTLSWTTTLISVNVKEKLVNFVKCIILSFEGLNIIVNLCIYNHNLNFSLHCIAAVILFH